METRAICIGLCKRQWQLQKQNRLELEIETQSEPFWPHSHTQLTKGSCLQKCMQQQQHQLFITCLGQYQILILALSLAIHHLLMH